MIEKEEKRSFETINYLLRPKKQIERKIIIEILQELNREIDVSNYLYIGFGSIYYYDFILFHKFLRLTNLLSIDDKSTERRFKFNRPYDFISFESKISTDYLSEFDWKQNVILWLDYDYELNSVVLADLKIIANNCKSKDILIVTLDTSCEKIGELRNKGWDRFYDGFGEYISPEYSYKKSFTPGLLQILLQDVIINYLKTMCEHRDIKFHKLFSFKYKDTTPMFTIGGIFDQTEELSNKDWKNDFICKTQKIIHIDVPILTYYEKFHIDSRIEELKQKIKEIEEKVEKDVTISNSSEKKRRMTEMVNEEIPFELPSFDALKKYLIYYKYYPQYYEGII